jgi:hypothetical protein
MWVVVVVSGGYAVVAVRAMVYKVFLRRVG